MKLTFWLWGRYVTFDRYGIEDVGRTMMARKLLLGIEVER